MSSDARIARIGFIALAICFALEIAIGLAFRWLLSQIAASDDVGEYNSTLELLDYAGLFVSVAAAAALFAVARVPVATRARSAAFASAVIASAAALLMISRTLIIRLVATTSTGAFERIILVFQVVNGLAVVAFDVLFAVVVTRVGRAVAARWTGPAAVALVAAAAVGVAITALGIAGIEITWLRSAWTIVYYASTALKLALSIALAVAVAHVKSPAPEPLDHSAISPRWRPVASGIAIYLVAVAIRIILGVVGFLVLRGGSDMPVDIGTIRSNVIVVAFLSGVAGLGLLAGLFQIGRAPDESDASGPAHAALALAVLSMLIDVASTYVTVSAFDSVSAAFAAQDLLPGLAALGITVACAAGAALMTSFRRSAEAIVRPDIAAAAHTTRSVLVATGVGAGMVILIAQWLSAPAALVIGLFVVAGALYTSVRFILVAVVLMRAIGARAADREPDNV